ncbi:unnamed protein product [Lymnaea stagnalis]|uniref:RUN and FYVE domain-containing protein 4 n=1 Tax=Lymnaea stagnalis TaxID=6523 RepID=A0AAV2H8A5_LYMST
MASAAQFPVSNEVPQKVVSQPMQKKILQDVLDCIVQMKCEFFDNHQPINDDSVVLQRFCAKFEHLVQVGMREKVSLLGRKKDYWDYFCECLASSKGSNDGIKYVKSLGENKTSLGKGRAFIRFCLVHQRLADTLQQCVVHDKTKDWFLPSSVLLNQKECQGLINSLYDLNSMHFDLSPRGYDLDSVWPSFANRKPGARGSWNVPLSRRSSITSMDTISQISMSIDTTEVDRLAKDLEVAHSVKSELIGQLGALQQEKELVSQTAWTAQGERQALEHQLTELRSQHAELLDKYNNLDVEHVKLKLEREHKTKLHIDELRQMDEKVKDEEARRVSLLKAEEDIWKKEVKEEGERRKREIDRLQKDVETKTLEAEELYDRWSRQSKALKTLILDSAVKTDPDDLETCLVHLADHIKNLQAQVNMVTLEKTSMQASLQGELSEKGEQASILLGRCLEMERVQKDLLGTQANLHTQMTTYEMDLKKEQDLVVSLQEKLMLLNSQLEQKETQLERVKEGKAEMERQTLESGDRLDDLIQENGKLILEVENLLHINAALSQTQENKSASLEEAYASLKEKEQNNFELTKSVEESRLRVDLLQSELTTLNMRILEKDEDIKLLQRNSDAQTTERQAVIESNKTALTETQDQLSKTLQRLELVSREAEEAGAGSQVLQEQLSSAQAEIVTLKSLSSDLGEKCASLEAEVEELSNEGRKKDALIEETNAASDLIRMECAAAQESLISVKAQAEKLGIESKRIDREREQRAVELAELRAEMENLKQEMDCEKSRSMGLLKESEGVKSSEGEKEENILNLVTELEKLRRDQDEAAASLGNTIVELTNKLVEKDEKLQSTLSEKETLASELEQERNVRLELLRNSKREVETLNSSIHGSESKLRSLIVELQVEIEEVKKHHETEVLSFAERISHLESELSNKEIILDSRSLDYENKITELKDDIAKLERSSLESSESIGKLTAQLAVLTEEKEHLLTQTDAALEDALQIKSQLTETSEQLAVSYTQLENMTKEKNSLSAAAANMSEELSKLQDEKDEIRREIQDLKIMLQLAEDESQEMLRQKRAVELEVEDMQARVSRLVEEKSELTSQLDSYQSQTEFSTKVLEEALVESREALEQVKADKLGLQENFESLEREKVELMTKQVKLEEENDELRRSNQRLQLQITPAQGSEIENLRLELEEERRTVENLNEEILALQFQLSSEQMLKKDFSQTQHAAEDTAVELKTRISELEIIVEQLEEECEHLRKTKETDSVQVSWKYKHIRRYNSIVQVHLEIHKKV